MQPSASLQPQPFPASPKFGSPRRERTVAGSPPTRPRNPSGQRLPRSALRSARLHESSGEPEVQMQHTPADDHAPLSVVWRLRVLCALKPPDRSWRRALLDVTLPDRCFPISLSRRATLFHTGRLDCSLLAHSGRTGEQFIDPNSPSLISG